ncbi:HNH endonuclease [Paenibacillus sp. OV219]|uniref:HNH endonuclease n=1 Tax=Paenibacillus sp. OV219 TaxID=1884377 RepID=UPI0008CEA096|nr:HNH endonuclease signature motif containing protein [Paenibacillus sp. OV219]SEM81262.1 5-methylcytosine-specific restriction enzyme A [Paenibacillus sp. OV219]
MPLSPKKPCGHIGCTQITRKQYCEKHVEDKYQYDRQRGSAALRGYDSKWRAARAGYLRKHPLCVECLNHEAVTEATVVDHIKPHKGDKTLFWDRNNWQSLCKKHHDIKTVKEDGGFGYRLN